MHLGDFHIGLEFWCSGRQWRCTDIGTRVVVAIRVDSSEVTRYDGETEVTRTLTRAEAEASGWFNGPPYGVPEHVFDEYALDACVLTPEEL